MILNCGSVKATIAGAKIRLSKDRFLIIFLPEDKIDITRRKYIVLTEIPPLTFLLPAEHFWTNLQIRKECWQFRVYSLPLVLSVNWGWVSRGFIKKLRNRWELRKHLWAKPRFSSEKNFDYSNIDKRVNAKILPLNTTVMV